MKIFITGISGWIGYYAVKYLQASQPNIKVFGSHRSNKIISDGLEVESVKVERNIDCLGLIQDIKPNFLLHLARGESDLDFEAHKLFINIMNQLNGHYSYASSFNACDAQLSNPHFEDEVGKAQSEYGIFKSKCEEELKTSSKSYSIFRFSATHGWAPNRTGRTEIFLPRQQNLWVHSGVGRSPSA